MSQRCWGLRVAHLAVRAKWGSMAAGRNGADAAGCPAWGCVTVAYHRTFYDCLFLVLQAALSSSLRSSSAFRATRCRGDANAMPHSTSGASCTSSSTTAVLHVPSVGREQAEMAVLRGARSTPAQSLVGEGRWRDRGHDRSPRVYHPHHTRGTHGPRQGGHRTTSTKGAHLGAGGVLSDSPRPQLFFCLCSRPTVLRALELSSNWVVPFLMEWLQTLYRSCGELCSIE